MDKSILTIILLIPLGFTPAFAQQQFCFEDTSDMCGLISNNPAEVFGGIQEPLNTQFEGLFMIIFWGGLMGIVWFKTENIMLLGIVGVLVSATVTGLSDTAQGIGMLLLSISIGILIFQLVRQRISIVN